MKFYLILGIGLGLAGCATNQISSNLNGVDGLTLKQVGGNSFLDRYEFSSQASASSDLAFCIASNLSNKDVQLSDTSKSFVGQASGNLYIAGDKNNAAGGEVIKYKSDDGSKVAAQGRADYSFTFGFAPISRTVQFDVVAKKESGKLLLSFTEIMQAQKETGFSANNGFQPVGAWDGANPDMALSTLKDVATKIQRCMN